MADSASATGVAPPKPKRSFFKKPSWKQKAGDADDDDPTAMFDGSKQTFSAIMEERERARAKQLQDQKETARRSELEAARRGKRQKTGHAEHRLGKDVDDVPAKQAEDETWGSLSATRGVHVLTSQSSMPAERSSSPHPAPSPIADPHTLATRYETVARAREPKRSSTVVIDLGDTDIDDDAPLPTEVVTKLPKPDDAPIGSDEDIDESDPEIREIIRATRRKQRHQSGAHGASPREPADRHDASPGAAIGASTSQAGLLPDPPVQILITSRIPDTKPLIVTRKLSQRLQEVRQAWCKRQGFTQEMTDSVFFTFKGRRLFDVATCRSMGLVTDASGHVHMKDSCNWDENDGKVTIEAVTPEIFNEDAREAQRQQEPESMPEVEVQPERKRKKIIIRTKDFGDAKFTCGLETTFEKLATTSVNRLNVPSGKRPYLLFDGERLDPGGTMAELDEFEDGDVLEMHFD